MSVLIYVDHNKGNLKKVSLETVSYGVALAKMLGTEAYAIVASNGDDDFTVLGKYGVSKVYHIRQNEENPSEAALLPTIQEIASQASAEVVIFTKNNTAKNIAGALAALLHAGIATGVIALPDISNGFVVKKAIFSGRAIAAVKINTPIKVITVNPNVYDLKVDPVDAGIEEVTLMHHPNKIKILEQDIHSGIAPLNEAEIVVAGGLGLRAPENWHLVTDLANVLHAPSACSRPVSDNGWRPHEEHVGQTGIQIAPSLYIAIGISGAIQHLGGVNQSKYIAVINKDREAPIFNIADFGMTGDLFDILPKLTEEIKKINS